MIYESCLFIDIKDKKYYEECLNDINKGYKDDFIQIGAYTFDNGFTIYVDLCSGNNNYFLQYELVDNKNNVVESDLLDSLEDFEIKDSKDTYVVHFDLYEE